MIYFFVTAYGANELSVFLDGDLIFQSLDVLDDEQLEHALKVEYKLIEEEKDIFSDFNY